MNGAVVQDSFSGTSEKFLGYSTILEATLFSGPVPYICE